MNNITINAHSSIKIVLNKVIYIDPFMIESKENNGDLILITHSHYDHYDKDSINKIIKPSSIFIIPTIMESIVKKDYPNNDIIALNEYDEYKINDICIKAYPSYNINKDFHPRSNHWLGYTITTKEGTIYIAGDTDATPEANKVNCDIAIVPIGGTYTMDYREASNLVNTIKPKIVIPSHYGSIVGSKNDAENFKKIVNKDIETKILID